MSPSRKSVRQIPQRRLRRRTERAHDAKSRTGAASEITPKNQRVADAVAALILDHDARPDRYDERMLERSVQALLGVVDWMRIPAPVIAGVLGALAKNMPADLLARFQTAVDNERKILASWREEQMLEVTLRSALRPDCAHEAESLIELIRAGRAAKEVRP